MQQFIFNTLLSRKLFLNTHEMTSSRHRICEKEQKEKVLISMLLLLSAYPFRIWKWIKFCTVCDAREFLLMYIQFRYNNNTHSEQPKKNCMSTRLFGQEWVSEREREKAIHTILCVSCYFDCSSALKFFNKDSRSKKCKNYSSLDF